MIEIEEEVSFGGVESIDDPRTIESSSIATTGELQKEGKVVLDFDHVNELCNQKKIGICTMCGVRMASENYFRDGVRLDEYWGYLMGKVFIDDPRFGHFEGSSSLTMLKTANKYGIPEKEFCEKFPLKTDGTYIQFYQSFLNDYNGVIPQAILDNAAKHKIPGYFRIASNPATKNTPDSVEIARQINQGRVVVARFALGDNLHTDRNGKYTRKAEDLLPVRAPEQITSGHIMNINEYWEAGLELGGPNSWSRTWCPDNEKQEAGYYWFEYATQIGYFTEAWAIMAPEDKYVFTKDLTFGSTGPDVVALQKYLVKNGFMVMPKGVSYGYFGSITQRAVASYQLKYDINPVRGYFGPKTRAHLNNNQ